MVGGMLRHMRSLRTMQRECGPDLSLLHSTDVFSHQRMSCPMFRNCIVQGVGPACAT